MVKSEPRWIRQCAYCKRLQYRDRVKEYVCVIGRKASTGIGCSIGICSFWAEAPKRTEHRKQQELKSVY